MGDGQPVLQQQRRRQRHAAAGFGPQEHHVIPCTLAICGRQRTVFTAGEKGEQGQITAVCDDVLCTVRITM